MPDEFCPDCGHLLSRNVTRCHFCSWSDGIDYLAGHGFVPYQESDLISLLLVKINYLLRVYKVEI